ncbi:hypothetical protein QYF61_002186 [Mycteria americana]|uniref:Uncharacterized protein n=1 Tax=Mycteria americana TaxID=33587 RepID=A0AAN7NI56_MYCAM|nr:hypothetical protein QYF61_002186 [Mycteria americana]
MGSPLLLLLLALLTAVTKAKVFSRCELAHLRQEEGLDGYGGYSLANSFPSRLPPSPWTAAMAQPECLLPLPRALHGLYESTFNTAAQSIKADSSADYGIFQMSRQQRRTDDRSPSDNRCGMACGGTTALLLWSQPQERRQQPKPSRSAQLHPVAKMELQGHAGPSLGIKMPVAAGSWG